MSKLKLTHGELNFELIARINALAVGESLTLPGVGVITCRQDQRADDASECTKCALFTSSLDIFCVFFWCTAAARLDGKYVHFELTDAPQVDNSTKPNKEESNA